MQLFGVQQLENGAVSSKVSYLPLKDGYYYLKRTYQQIVELKMYNCLS